MPQLLNPAAIRLQVSKTFSGLCNSVPTTLTHTIRSIVNHETVTVATVEYSVFAVADRIHQILKPGSNGERITTQLISITADGIPDDEDTSIAQDWTYTDTQGKTHAIVEVKPIRPVGNIVILYELELAR